MNPSLVIKTKNPSFLIKNTLTVQIVGFKNGAQQTNNETEYISHLQAYTLFDNAKVNSTTFPGFVLSFNTWFANLKPTVLMDMLPFFGDEVVAGASFDFDKDLQKVA